MWFKNKALFLQYCQVFKNNYESDLPKDSQNNEVFEIINISLLFFLLGFEAFKLFKLFLFYPKGQTYSGDSWDSYIIT